MEIFIDHNSIFVGYDKMLCVWAITIDEVIEIESVHLFFCGILNPIQEFKCITN